MEGLGIDIKYLVAQIINFTLFFFIFKKYLAAPFAKFLAEEKRKQEEKDKADLYLKQQQEKLTKELEKQKKDLEKEYEKALLKAKTDAKAYKEKIIEQAKVEAEEIIASSKKKIAAERKAMEKELEKKAVNLAKTILEKAFDDVIDAKTQKEINQQILKNLKKIN
ncbi:MAG: hypothetical protein ACPLRN_01650 [Microgenomates group bacterium]